jgi:hypothetical protein
MSISKRRLILALTAREDAHVPYVQRHLVEPMIIIDPMVDPTSQLSYSFTKQHLQVIYDGKEIQNPLSIWYRRPRIADYETIPVAKRNLNYSKSALDMHWSALYSLFSDVFWVSDYNSIQRAGRKPMQLDAAARLGFCIPETLFTSDSLAAEDFLKRQKTCIVKPLAYRSMLTEEGVPKPFLTRQIHYKDKINFSGLYLAPSIFQQAIDVDFELRVTVVGDKVFTGAITTTGLSGSTPYRDYKLGYLESGAKVVIKPYELPQDIADKCVAHARALNLSFSAIDLLVDKKGVFWFLENNPNGQWAFIEKETGAPIGKAFADLLQKGKR